ncbi:hypothetical protein Ciccas_007419 [Cichlidogyrus casuarinus]|uniref:DAGKc domain-containing protein n=1 Tax=Cichlidogyrus casuarinus TaxID=1844966 RepID=A0ABD2Q6X2_9PLAT
MNPFGNELKKEPKHITIFVNYKAYGGALKRQFDEYFMPYINLAGFNVQFVYTDHDAEVKDYIKNLKPSETDALLFVGDDNVLQQGVTSVLRNWSNSSEMPIGIFPLGVWNTFSKLSFACKNDLVTRAFTFVNPVLFNHTEQSNVLSISKLNPDGKPAQSPPVYSLCGLEWNLFRDLEYRNRSLVPVAASYQSERLRPASSSPFQFFKWITNSISYSWSWRKVQSAPPSSVNSSFHFDQDPINETSKGNFFYKKAIIRYTLPCPGCDLCLKSTSPIHKCGEIKEVSVEDASCISVVLLGDKIRICIQPAKKLYSSFMSDAFSFLRSQAYLEQLMPINHNQSDEAETNINTNLTCVDCTSATLYPLIQENEYFWIDNDYFEASPVEINILKNALKLYKPDEFMLY